MYFEIRLFWSYPKHCFTSKFRNRFDNPCFVLTVHNIRSGLIEFFRPGKVNKTGTSIQYINCGFLGR